MVVPTHWKRLHCTYAKQRDVTLPPFVHNNMYLLPQSLDVLSTLHHNGTGIVRDRSQAAGKAVSKWSSPSQ